MSAPRKCFACGADLGWLPECAGCGTAANVGRVIADKYRIDAPLGSGGMSNVYRATHLALGVSVAIKLLRVQLAFEAMIRERFRREAVALASLRHPGIVALLDYGEADGELYTVMELLDGRTLAPPPDGMAVSEAGPIFDQVLAALEACHGMGIVHRDVKPSNVMLTTFQGAERAKLIDFGLVRTIGNSDDKLTATGFIQGTPRYMAPEQCRGDEVGPPADVYALGVSMYEVLTGREPFSVSDPASLMAHHLFVEPAPMREHVPSLAAGLDALVSWAMAKDADRRPTAAVMRSELAAVLRGTDARSVTEAASLERHRLDALAREERALPEATNRVTVPPAVTGAVLAWLPSGPRASELRVALGARGLPTSIVVGDELIGAFEPDTVVLLSARHDGLGRLERLRARDARLPVIVVDVRGVEEASVLVRAGVSDFSLEDAPDTELGAKIQRLLRRQKRGQAARDS